MSADFRMRFFARASYERCQVPWLIHLVQTMASAYLAERYSTAKTTALRDALVRRMHEETAIALASKKPITRYDVN